MEYHLICFMHLIYYAFITIIYPIDIRLPMWWLQVTNHN